MKATLPVPPAEGPPAASLSRTDAASMALLKRSERIRPAHIAIALISLVPLLVGIQTISVSYLLQHPLLFLFFALSAVYPVFSYKRVIKVSARTALDSDEVKTYGDVDQDEVAVVVTIVQSGIITGIDVGLLIPDPDRLVFTGRRSSFCLGTQDLWRERIPDDGMSSAVHGDPMFVGANDQPCAIYIGTAQSARKINDAKRSLWKITGNFRVQSPAEAPRQFPPLTWDPTLGKPRRHPFDFQTVIFAALVTFLLILLGQSTLAWLLVPLVPLIQFIAWSAGPGPKTRQVYLSLEASKPIDALDL